MTTTMTKSLISDEEKEVLKRAIKQWGDLPQMGKAIEECSELIRALSRHAYQANSHSYVATHLNVIEEIADCFIMLEQLRMIFDSESIDAEIHQKIKRLRTRLDTYDFTG
jgi:hypothetical protein